MIIATKKNTKELLKMYFRSAKLTSLQSPRHLCMDSISCIFDEILRVYWERECVICAIRAGCNCGKVPKFELESPTGINAALCTLRIERCIVYNIYMHLVCTHKQSNKIPSSMTVYIFRRRSTRNRCFHPHRDCSGPEQRAPAYRHRRQALCR